MEQEMCLLLWIEKQRKSLGKATMYPSIKLENNSLNRKMYQMSQENWVFPRFNASLKMYLIKDEYCKYKPKAMIVHWMESDSSAMVPLQLMRKHNKLEKVFFGEKGKQVT